MAQVRRTPRYRSPPPRQIPSLPNPIRIQLPTQTNIRIIPARSQNDHFNSINNAQQSLLSLTPSSNQLPNKNNNTTDESVILPQLNLDDDAFLVRKHLPVYAEFPFDVSRLSQPMEINIEDNIHKLRLRLIESELNHQRRSTNEYIKRTHRIGMDSDLPNNSDIEQDFNIRRMQESRNQRRRSNQLMVSNYTYDNRLHLQSVNEEPVYRTSNMDDLIDSMARRHLAHRRLDAAIERQRRGNYIESLNTGQTSYRNDNLLYTNRSSDIENDSVLINPNSFNQRLRSRIDYYNRIQPDVDSMVNGNSSGTNSHKKLPPISPRRDINHRKRDSSTSTLYDKKNHHNSSDRSEHDIDLPSDIFLSSRTKKSNVSPRNRKTRRRSISKDTRSGTDRSDGENEIPPMTDRHKKTSKNDDDDDGFFTESTNRPRKKSKIRRNLFRKAAIGILFLMTLKHRSIKTRTNQLKRSPSATIHKIRLQEIIVALHRVYLEPDGPIFNALIQAISNPISLEAALNSSSKNYTEAIKTIGNALKNIISKITDFMPKDGILGTGKTSAVSVLIQDGNRFPENYFWQCERKLLEFDGLKVINITKQRAILLLIGIFIFRALVTTLLIKPIKYRLILGQLKPNQSISLKVLASVILYIGRRVVGSKSQILTLPHEWQLSLYSDAHIQAIIQHSEIKSIIDTCEKSLRIWCEEYIRRIDESYDKKLRI